jgi:hypothetical protein
LQRSICALIVSLSRLSLQHHVRAALFVAWRRCERIEAIQIHFRNASAYMPRIDGASFSDLYKPAKRRFADALTKRQFVRHNTRIAAPNLCPLPEAFSSEMDTGSRQENASNRCL